MGNARIEDGSTPSQMPASLEGQQANPTPMTPTERDGFEVHHTVRTEERKCEYGYKHMVDLYETTTIYPTGRTWLCDNGYTKEQEPVYEDAEGREYLAKPPIDYYGGTAYLRPKDDGGYTFWHRRPPALGRPVDE